MGTWHLSSSQCPDSTLARRNSPDDVGSRVPPLYAQQADLLRLSRINFSELFQVLVHLKVVRAHVESVLRYGLPAAYFGAVVKVSLIFEGLFGCAEQMGWVNVQTRQ